MAEPPSLLQAAERALELALKAGGESCDVWAQEFDESSVTVRMGELEKLVEAGSRGLGLRVIKGGRTAVCSTTDFGDDSLRSLAAAAVSLAELSAFDEHAGLPSPGEFAGPLPGDLGLFDEAIPALALEHKIGMARTCEAAALGFDRRITNSDGATFAAKHGEVALVNSLGFRGAYPATSVTLAVEVMVDEEDGKKRNAHWFSAERSLRRLLPEEDVGNAAARRAIAQIGARKVDTRTVPVVFEPRRAADLMRLLASCALGSALYRGATFLAGAEGGQIGSALVNIVDDPRLRGRVGTRPFDGEGVTTARRPLFELGAFRGFLFDVYTGRRAGQRTTGSAQRGLETSPAPGGSNLVWAAGETAADAIVGDVRDGLYVTDLMGFGFNPTTGDFSRGAGGFWIRDGEIAFPVAEVNVSGRMSEMLAAVDAVGDDLTWFGSLAAPTVRIAEMTVSGL